MSDIDLEDIMLMTVYSIYSIYSIYSSIGGNDTGCYGVTEWWY